MPYKKLEQNMPYKKLEIDNPKKLIFGFSSHPLKYGFDLKIGNSKVIPELKYFPKPPHDKLDRLKKIYREITKAALKRVANLGFPALQLETEYPEPLTLKKGWGRDVIKEQKSLMEKYWEEYGIKSALRATPSDSRRKNLRSGKYLNAICRAFQEASDAGADLVSIESRGGQEIFSRALIRGDFRGILFGLWLATKDVKFLWNEICKVVEKAVPAGDSACAFANSAMKLADGLYEKKLPHVLAAVIRAMSAVRSLAAFESGAKGPSKDCAYEGIILKAITGRPISMEGKLAAFAHSSLFGNIAAAACDLWSNEQIEHREFSGGFSPAVVVEMLSYDCELFNKAISKNKAKELQKLLIISDRFKDPQSLVLSPKNAIRIGNSIIKKESCFERLKASAAEACSILKENSKKLKLDKRELKWLDKIRNQLEKLPPKDRFVDEQCKKYSFVKKFHPKNYLL